jgi:hypothetical protein
MRYYWADERVVGMRPKMLEVSCRYCGERFLLSKGEYDETTVVHDKEGCFIGYAHDICWKRRNRTHGPEDDLAWPTDHSPGVQPKTGDVMCEKIAPDVVKLFRYAQTPKEKQIYLERDAEDGYWWFIEGERSWPSVEEAIRFYQQSNWV